MSTLFHPCMHDNVVCGVCTFDLCLCGGVHVRIVFVIHHMFTYHFVILFISWLIYLDYSSLLLLLLLSLSLSESFHLFRICVLWLSICVIFSTLNLTIDFFRFFVLFCFVVFLICFVRFLFIDDDIKLYTTKGRRIGIHARSFVLLVLCLSFNCPLPEIYVNESVLCGILMYGNFEAQLKLRGFFSSQNKTKKLFFAFIRKE